MDNFQYIRAFRMCLFVNENICCL